MKKLYKMIVIISCISSILQINSYAQFFTPQSAGQFENIVAGNELVVAHFVNYDMGEQKTDGIQKGDIDDMKDAFRRASDTSRYKKAGVAFVAIDVTRMPELRREYEMSDSSLLILFENGELYGHKKRKGRTTQLLPSVGRIKDFIDTYLEDDIEVILEREREKRTRQYQARYTSEEQPKLAQGGTPEVPAIYNLPNVYHYPTYSREYPHPRRYITRAYAQHYHPPHYHAPYKLYRTYSLHHPFYGRYHPQYSEFRNEQRPYGEDVDYDTFSEKRFRGRYDRSNYVPGDVLHGRRQGFHKNFGWNW